MHLFQRVPPFALFLSLAFVSLAGAQSPAALPLNTPTGGAAATNPPGVTTRATRFGVVDSMDRVEALAKAAGARVYARIDLADVARKGGQRVRPNQVLIYDPGKSIGPLLVRAPMIALDLPMKLAIWEDESGKSWVSYTGGMYLARRYQLDDNAGALADIDAAILRIVDSAIK